MKGFSLSKILFSTRLTAVLFIVFAAAMAAGTFLDANEETSPTALTRTMIYNAWWFEAIMVFFVINFLGNIFRYRLHKKENWATLTLHLAFIFIFIGAFVTRYIGYEGMMSIREGATENEFLSQETYISAYIDGDYRIDGVPQRKAPNYKVDFSERLDNHFRVTEVYDQQEVTFELEKFVSNAEEDVIYDPEGEAYLKIVEAGDGQPHNHFLKAGETQSIHNVLFTLNQPIDGAINIVSNSEGQMTIESPFEGSYLTMATMQDGILVKDSIQPLQLRSRYVVGNLQFVIPKPVITGYFDVLKKSKLLKGDEDGIVLKVTSNGESKRFNLLGGKGTYNAFKQEQLGGLDIALRYGSKVHTLPFSVKLNDFEAERYPGTENSFSSFSSKVTVIDNEKGDYNYKIFMNHILDHRGYRFFQSSFDPDEKGTILSVNHDLYGTWITYIGYMLLYFGLMAILFSKYSRFGSLKQQLDKVKFKKQTLLIVFGLCSSFIVGQNHTADDGHNHKEPTKASIDSVIKANIIPKTHTDKFGTLVVQDMNGRMMPANTFGSEILRKLSKYDTYEGMDANQILLSMQQMPLYWYTVPVIYLKPKKGDSIRRLIGVDKSIKYVALSDFLRNDGSYILEPYLEDAYKAQVPNAFQKEFKDIDQKVNLLYNTLGGRNLRIFPVPDDENNKWISVADYQESYKTQINDSLYGTFIENSFKYYLSEVYHSKSSGDYSSPESLLDGFKRTQHKLGGDVMLSKEKIEAEIWYNKYDVFKKLFSWFLYVGFFFFVILILQIFNSGSRWISFTVIGFRALIFGLFVIHTAGLILRWYISGHAPWSDAYESMIYVAWATMFFGLAFGRKSDLTIASTAFVTAMILMVAHWNWMDPAIANLQPVLNSYWLMIHVAVIVASYGPFALGMILGVVCLLLMIFTNSKNKQRVDLNIKELTIINEMALTVGLVMLTIGNFLGGMWANESWGRYWGWDPKETWALISIMVYAFVIHMRLVPGLRGRFAFNLSAIIAFGSILMTYFGVNFYLSGLHSYASGDQIMSVKFIGITCSLIFVLAFFAFRKYKLYYKK